MMLQNAQEAARRRAAQTGHVYHVVQRADETREHNRNSVSYDEVEYLVVAERNLSLVMNVHPCAIPIFCTAE